MDKRSELMKMDSELDRMTRERMRGSDLNYGAAFRLIASEHRDMVVRRESLIRMGDEEEEREQRLVLSEMARLDGQIDALVRGKMDAEKLTYRQALLLVANEVPDLFRRRDRVFRQGTRCWSS